MLYCELFFNPKNGLILFIKLITQSTLIFQQKLTVGKRNYFNPENLTFPSTTKTMIPIVLK